MPKGPCSSLSSLALQKGNISLPQLGPHKTRLYLQRASSQHTISMQKHEPRCTMENIQTHQRSLVAPALLHFSLSVNPPAVPLWCKDVRREGEWTITKTKGKRACVLYSTQLCFSRSAGMWMLCVLFIPGKNQIQLEAFPSRSFGDCVMQVGMCEHGRKSCSRKWAETQIRQSRGR